MKKYQAILISPDGIDYVTDFSELHCKSITEVWEYIANMGSKWFFYPIPFVIKANSFHNKNERILDIPDNFPLELKNKSVKTVMQWIADNQDYIKASMS
jgi:hypothetical protein